MRERPKPKGVAGTAPAAAALFRTAALTCLLLTPSGTAIAERNPDEALAFRTKTIDYQQSKKVLVEAVRAMELFAGRDGLCKRLKSTVAVMVFPSVVRSGLGIVFTEGVGVFLRRFDDNDRWSSPAFVGFSSVSFGFQIAMQETKHLVLYQPSASGATEIDPSATSYDGSAGMALWGINATLNDSSPHPRGRGHPYSIEDGFFVGAAFSIEDVAPRDDWNRALYGRPVSFRSILQRGYSDNSRGLGAYLTSMTSQPCL